MIRFKTKHHADVVMHDAMAEKLIKKMGASATIPSALSHDMLADAIERLTQTLQASAEPVSADPSSVGLSVRAKPLIDLLQTALKTNETILWQKTNSF